MLFGGADYSVSPTTFLNDTWEYDGTAWIRATTTAAPPAGVEGAIAYDGHTSKVLLLTGWSPTPPTLPNQTWLWDGTDWLQASVPNPPTRRYAAAMLGTGTRTIVWSGIGDNRMINDMWEWTGTDWMLIDSGAPSDRTNYGAAYDARRDRTVVFGGMSTNNRASATYNNETWEWDGDSWLQRFPANAPSPRGWCKMTYDAARSRVVLFGGADANINNSFQDTWEWDGANWTQITPAARPPGSLTHDLTFDTARNVAVAFGSFGTWDYGPIYPASTASFPAVWPTPTTCTGSLGPIRIQTLPWSGPWLGDRFEVDFVNRPANSLGLFLWGFSNTTWNGLPLPIPLSILNVPSPCNLLVDPFVTELVLAPRYQSFLLPNDPILLSLPMFVQAGFFDNGTQGTQIVTTNGLELTFGRK